MREGQFAPTISPPRAQSGRGGPTPLSLAQQRLWLLAEMAGLKLADHVELALRLIGELDRAALRRALDRVLARHEVLRATFAYENGQPAQRIGGEGNGFALEEDDSGVRPETESELERLSCENSERPFDLRAGPLARGRLVRLADREHALLIALHDIVSDEPSIELLKRELSALYGAFRQGRPDPLPELALQYPDYAIWQRLRLSAEPMRAQSAYWRGALAGAPKVLELPTDRRRPAQQDFAAALVAFELHEPLTAALKALSRRQGTSLSTTLLAAWASLLARLSGQGDLVIGLADPYRIDPQFEPLIGRFVNNLPIRLDLSGQPSVAELLGRVETRVREARARRDIPFEQIVELLDPPRSLAHEPLFQAIFAWRERAETELALPGLTVAPIATARRYSRFELTLKLNEAQGRVVGELEYATALFDRATAERHAGYLRNTLEGMAADERQAMDRLPLMSEAERRQVLFAWNATEAAYPRDKCVHELIEAQVARTPDAVAVAFEGDRLTYAEMNASANRLAHRLRRLGVRSDDRVAVCMERGPEMLIALLGVLKAGAAYVPLDPVYPAERLAYMLEDSSPAAIVSEGAARESLERVAAGATGRPLIVGLEEGGPAPAARNPDPAEVSLTTRSLAYVIYTSGSTGRPKGVMVEHRGLTNCVWSMRSVVGLEPSDCVLALTTIAFDIAGLELYLPLVCGARTVIAKRALASDPARIFALIASEGVTVLQATPSTWRMLIEAGWAGKPGLKALTGGEALPAALAAQIIPRAGRLINLYGPTETTIWSSAWPVTPSSRGSFGVEPIGAPIANTRIHILDGRREPVPVGGAGEIYIGGDGVARGYWRRAALTAELFVADPFASGERLYRTGDLGRRLADGTIEYLGRADFQVKIRGFRIELGEIEARLAEHPSVREAAALAREEATGDRRLAAYYTLRSDGPAPDAAALRAHLAASLPDYMVPAAYVRLEAMPLTANGKLDRKGLPTPEADAYAAKPYEPPQGETEATLARIFARALKLERVGRHDDFFDLGGDSLLGVGAVFEIEKALSLKLSTASLFLSPTVAGLAADLDRGRARPEMISLVPLYTREPGAPIFMVHLIERDVARRLGRRRPVYGLSYGLSALSAEDEDYLPESVESVATHYIEQMRLAQPHGPYRLIGHSLGGVIAYEMAQQLALAGVRVAFLGLIDAEAPDPERKQRLLPLHQVFLNVIRTPPKKLLTYANDRINESSSVRHLRIRFLSTQSSFRWRLHNVVEASYRPQPYYGRVDLFRAELPNLYIRREPPPAAEETWRGLALGSFHVHRLPGGHMDVVKEPGAVLTAEAIERALAASTGEN